MPSLMPTGKQQYFYTGSSKPLAGGKVYTYAAGATTPKATYQDAAGTTPNTNPVVLDSTGSALIFWTGSYKVVVMDAVGNTIYTVDNYNTDQAAALQTSLLSSIGSALLGFIQDAIGAVQQTIQDVLRERVSVTNFGASPNKSEAENVIAFQKALDHANTKGGLKVRVPAGVYLLNAALTIYKNTALIGDGWGASRLVFSHTGNGLTSTWPINSSTAANINVTGVSLENTNSANAGAAFVDVGGTYLNLEGNRFSGSWNYGAVLDQSELVVVDQNNFSGLKAAQLWLVNGPDNTPGANPGFTNRITVKDNEFNADLTTDLIRDDGGANHIIIGNNFNAGKNQMRISGTALLTILNNECEACAGFNIYLADTTEGGRYVGGVEAFTIENNQFGLGSSDTSTRSPNNIYIDEAYHGAIKNNSFYRATAAAIDYNYGTNYRISGISVSGNTTFNKISDFAATPTPLVPADKLQVWKAQGCWTQAATTYCSSAFAAGYQQVTPATMVGIYDGARLRVVNNDGSNPETVVATQLSATTFFCTFASSKSAGFRIFLEQGDYSGTYTPQVTGSGPTGGSSATTAYGSFTKVGNRCLFQANDTWTSLTGGAAGQLYLILPFPARMDSTALPVIPCLLTGPGAVGAGQLYLSPIPGTRNASLVKVDQATGALAAVPLPTQGSIYVCGNYEI